MYTHAVSHHADCNHRRLTPNHKHSHGVGLRLVQGSKPARWRVLGSICRHSSPIAGSGCRRHRFWPHWVKPSQQRRAWRIGPCVCWIIRDIARFYLQGRRYCQYCIRTVGPRAKGHGALHSTGSTRRHVPASGTSSAAVAGLLPGNTQLSTDHYRGTVATVSAFALSNSFMAVATDRLMPGVHVVGLLLLLPQVWRHRWHLLPGRRLRRQLFGQPMGRVCMRSPACLCPRQRVLLEVRHASSS